MIGAHRDTEHMINADQRLISTHAVAALAVAGCSSDESPEPTASNGSGAQAATFDLPQGSEPYELPMCWSTSRVSERLWCGVDSGLFLARRGDDLLALPRNMRSRYAARGETGRRNRANVC